MMIDEKELNQAMAFAAWHALKHLCPGRASTMETRLALKWRTHTNSIQRALTLELEEARGSKAVPPSDYIGWVIDHLCLSCTSDRQRDLHVHPYPAGEHRT